MMPVCDEQKTLITTPSGRLELVMSCPQLAKTPEAIPYAVICHPHPLYGGTMDNKVVYTLSKTLNALGAGTVRFNFRGVGKSSGKYADGEGETQDLQAVVTWLNAEYAPRQLWIAGYSFGGYIALRGHQSLKAERLLLVAPAVERFTDMPNVEIPTLIIQGLQDEVLSVEAVTTWAQQQAPYCQLVEIDQADHFFHRQLNELRSIIEKWMM
jgi:hypothetical protein